MVNGAGGPQAEIAVVAFGDGAPTGIRGITGRDGIVRVTWPPRSPGTSTAEGKWRAQAAIALPLDPPVFEWFDLEKIPEKPIRLVLPPTGSVRVALVKRDGAPSEEPATVSVGLEPGMYDAGRLPEAFTTTEAVASGGGARFPRVGLGGDLTVSAVPNDPALRTVSATVGAPRSEGEEIAVTLVCGGPAVIVTGKLVTPERRVFARAHLRADVSEGAEDPYEPGLREHASTDDAGRFSLRFDTDAHGLSAQQREAGNRERPGSRRRYRISSSRLEA